METSVLFKCYAFWIPIRFEEIMVKLNLINVYKDIKKKDAFLKNGTFYTYNLLFHLDRKSVV